MSPQFFESGKPVRHPLEDKFNATAWDILCAIEKGFRAQVDVKGKLAEWFLNKLLEGLRVDGVFTKVEWGDEDGQPDFRLVGKTFDLRLECKNLRSDEKYADGSYKLETQKTRNQKLKEGQEEQEPRPKGTRWYKVSEFDIVAACLFNQTRSWEYLFARTTDLKRHPKDKACLYTMQRVPPTPAPWRATLPQVLDLFTEASP
ncbi:MAG TPA: hypothetical protein VFE78_09365 [Gemmataceae bacterium]|nr:hypothetical protein [Gemmataceae bacterium]